MASHLAAEIRNRLAHYLAGHETLRAFEDWFVPYSWNVQQTGDRGAADLVYAIELYLAEFANGDLTEAELRGHLAALCGSSPDRPATVPAETQSG